MERVLCIGWKRDVFSGLEWVGRCWYVPVCTLVMGLSFHFLTLSSVVQCTAMQPPSPPHIVLMILLILKHFHFAKIVETWSANFSCIYNWVKLIPILVRLSVSVTLVLLCHFHFLWNVFVWSCPLNLIYMWGMWVGPYLWVPSPLLHDNHSWCACTHALLICDMIIGFIFFHSLCVKEEESLNLEAVSSTNTRISSR